MTHIARIPLGALKETGNSSQVLEGVWAQGGPKSSSEVNFKGNPSQKVEEATVCLHSPWDRRAPKDAQVLIPGTCAYVLLHGKEELRLPMELRLLILRWEIILDYPGGLI